MASQQDGAAIKLATGLGLFGIGLGLAEVIAPKGVERLIGLRDRGRPRGVLRASGLREIASGVGILTQRRSANWVWSRVAGDVLDLAAIGTAYTAPGAKKGRLTFAAASVLGVTALDILCSQQLGISGEAADGAARFSRSIVIDRKPEEVYQFWRNLENVPKFMRVIESVESHDGQRSHWRSRLPGGRMVEWDAEVVEDQPDRQLSWRTVDGSKIRRSGTVRFETAPGDRGTLVRLEMELDGPGGRMLTKAARASGIPQTILSQGLRRLKQILETGEVVQSDSSLYRGFGMHPAQPPETVPEEVLARA